MVELRLPKLHLTTCFFLALNAVVSAQNVEESADGPSGQINRLSFSGWGLDQPPLTGRLTFSGWITESTVARAPLGFSGWGDTGQNVTGKLSFTGWRQPSSQIAGRVSFSGWAIDAPNISATLSFKGCGGEGAALLANAQPPEFQNPLAGQNIALEGNYIVEWGNLEQNRAFATLSKGAGWGLGPEGNDPEELYRFARDPNAAWYTRFWFPEVAGQRHTDSGSEDIEMRQGGLMQVSHGYGWHYGLKSDLIAVQDQIVGEWRDGEDSGYEIWTKVSSVITYTSTVRNRLLEILPVGMPVTLVSNYVDERMDMRGNRDEVTLRIHGTGLWGLHYFWISRQSGLELNPVNYICESPESGYDTHSNDQVCFGQGGVVGLEFRFNVWPKARTGPQVLIVDGEEINFNLEITGAPAAKNICPLGG